MRLGGTRFRHGWRVNSARVKCVAFSPDGKLLATAGSGPLVHLWDVASGKELRRLEGDRKEQVQVLRFSPGGHSLASGGSGGTIHFLGPGHRQGNGPAERAFGG